MADISTPIVVPCTESTSRGSASGSAARRIACQATARASIETHISARPTSTHTGWDSTSAWAIGRIPMRSSASSVPTAAPAIAAPTATPPRDPQGAVAAGGGRGSSDGSRRGRRARPAVGGQRPDADGGALRRALRRGTARASSYASTTCSATRGQA